ncbi:BamA/TamA family outer membrane protein [Pedobacter gandavensis]|uniref:BamA/TamA family outer membrane protein n=1 Tax=Pedobacter TaxID=84567 RepID=UPI002106D342|nr:MULTISPECIES: BamA/TamA family outer membrane protein [Pedobacter]WGQ10125.1 BamA/TamA family outer membrane protein [Pedobacter gandavensis]
MKIKQFSKISIVLLALVVSGEGYSYGQSTNPKDSLNRDSVKSTYDIADLIHQIFRPGKPQKPAQKKSGITPMPSIAYNPSIGAQIGLKAVAGRVLGHEPNTLMSIAATSASITTKGIIYFYLAHNIYTPGNRWNFQGSLVAAKTVVPDFGFGIGAKGTGTPEEIILANPDRKGYVIHGQYYNFREKVYKQVMDHLFVGAGVSIDIRRALEDKSNPDGLTPYHIYSREKGFKTDHYLANGFLFNLQYTTRDNQNRAHKGIYADAGLRVNQSWIGSTKNAVQVTTDFRKYWSLSSKNPEHVLAFWNWGSYLVSGTLPYLELPGTGKDANYRSGRGYTVGYFKGTNYFYSELEYRFPITANKFLSGVTFVNVQTANDNLGTKIFQKWQPAGGAGLRILFNKATRTNLCVDYAFGNYGAKGLFLGLNEVF